MKSDFCSDKTALVPTLFRLFSLRSERRNAFASRVFGFCSDCSDLFAQIRPIDNLLVYKIDTVGVVRLARGKIHFGRNSRNGVVLA